MISNLILILKESVIPLGPLGVFSASFIEEVVAPIPSAVVLLLSGFLFLSGPFSFDLISNLFLKIVIPASLGITIGSYFVYGIAYYLGRPFLKKWGRYLGVSWESVEKAQNKFSNTKKDELALFSLRSVPVIPSVAINAFCGLVRFPIFSYTLMTFLGSTVRASILGLVGWKVGGLYEYYANTFDVLENAIFIALLVALALFIILKSLSRDISD